MDFIDPPALKVISIDASRARARARTCLHCLYGYLFDLRVDWGGFAFNAKALVTELRIAALWAETYGKGLLKCG